MKLTIFMLLAWTICVHAFGQNQNPDTLLNIDEVFVIGKKPTKNQDVGARITTIENSVIDANKTKSLSELLSENSTIQIKSMGQGAMATASFRGTSSSHTKVLWNGISLNSPSIGNFDFSQVPIYFTDDISLYHGSGAQESGSGALGGSVNFKTNSANVKKPSLSILSEYGSNSTFTEGLNFRTTHKRLTSSTRIYYQQSKNDYKYLNKVYSKDPFYERRKDAQYKQSGAMQEFYYDTKKGDKFTAIAWWQYDNRSLPQAIIVNASAHEQTKSNNIRTLFSYDGVRNNHKFKATVSYLNGLLDYRREMGLYGSQHTKNVNNSFISKGEYNFVGFSKIDLAADFTYRYDRVVSDNFEDKNVDRNTLSVRFYTTFRATKHLHFDAQTTLETVDNNFFATYNITARYKLIENLLTLKASNSYNHRMPTLNDLYWQPGGNANLKPETGFSWDATASVTPQFGVVKVKFDASYYFMNINDWIMWIPNGNGYIWEPANFSKVKSQGLELNMSVKFDVAKTEHKFIANYGYAHSVDNTERNSATFNKQLPYIPRNKWNLSYNFTFKNSLWLNYSVAFTDKRFITADESYFTTKYTIHNAEAGYKLLFKRGYSGSLSLKVENLFNAYYESTQYFPMPLRMFFVKLAFNF